MAETIMDFFTQMAYKETGTNLLNVYKGVPLSFPAKIIEVGDTYLRVLTDTHQMVSMYLEKSTLIQSEDLPEIVRAEVIELDIKKHMAFLTNFHYVEKGIGNRAEVRIEPKDPLPSQLQDNEEQITLKGELADISREGMGIYLDRANYSSKLIHPNAQLEVIFNLPFEYFKTSDTIKPQSETGLYDRYSRENIRFNPISATGQKHQTGPLHEKLLSVPNIQIKAQVVNIHLEKGHDRFRIGMRMLPNSQAAAVISKFISQRQCEIIQEIRELYQLLVNPEGDSQPL
ncbi:MAG: hypothetical protein AB9891_16845 [Anaerolineaceae bacterium]